MTMGMGRLQRFLSSRQLHTIISRQTIKPSSPTPFHLKTHHLSLVDKFAADVNVPIIFFYKNYKDGDINILKNSLSQSLTSYYPLAGRYLATPVPKIDCNDQGVDFLEAFNDSRLSDLINKKEVDETIDQLIPNYVLGNANKPSLVEVQLTHFTCGGAAVAVSISHKIGDAFTSGKFISHWATVARGGSSKNPTFLSSESNIQIPEFEVKATDKLKYVKRRFVFPNSKLNELKNKVSTLVNPTRVEIVSSLIFKCAVDAATTLSGSLQPSNMIFVVNMRKKIMKQNFPEIAAGNILSMVVVKMADSGDQIKLSEVIAKLRKVITEIKEVNDVEEVGDSLNKMWTSLDDQSRTYTFSSACRLPFYEVDFGWGKPAQVIINNEFPYADVIILLDTPSGDGIEAFVQLKEEEMGIFQKNKEIIEYTN